MLLDPIKPIQDEKFVFSLQELSKNPNNRQEYRKKYKQRKGITSSQGRPIFSSVQIYKHYLKKSHWRRASQLPIVLSFFERSLHCHNLIASIGEFVHPEFVLWATSSQGVNCTKKCYETLETYGDTILKLAATYLAYDRL
jgi:hypothetical protein